MESNGTTPIFSSSTNGKGERKVPWGLTKNRKRVTTQKVKGTQMRRPQMPYLLVHKEKVIPINKRINTVTKIDTSFGM